jgi:hypothetical protein
MGSLNQFSHVLALQGQFAENIFNLGVNANFPRRFQPTHGFWSHGRSLTCGACRAAPRRVGFEVSRIRLVVGENIFPRLVGVPESNVHIPSTYGICTGNDD